MARKNPKLGDCYRQAYRELMKAPEGWTMLHGDMLSPLDRRPGGPHLNGHAVLIDPENNLHDPVMDMAKWPDGAWQYVYNFQPGARTFTKEEAMREADERDGMAGPWHDTKTDYERFGKQADVSLFKTHLPFVDLQGLTPEQSAFQRTHPQVRQQILEGMRGGNYQNWLNFAKIHKAQSMHDVARAQEGRRSPYAHPSQQQPYGNPATNAGGTTIKLPVVRETGLLPALASFEDDDLADEIRANGGEVNGDGTVTVYHHTSPELADVIHSSGKMHGNEDGIFFTTKGDQESQGAGRGGSVVKLHVPLSELQLDDVFGDEAHVKVPTRRAGDQVDVSRWLRHAAAEWWKVSGYNPETGEYEYEIDHPDYPYVKDLPVSAGDSDSLEEDQHHNRDMFQELRAHPSYEEHPDWGVDENDTLLHDSVKWDDPYLENEVLRQRRSELEKSGAGPRLTWDEIGRRHPGVYGDPEVHGEAAEGSDGEGIGWAAAHLAFDRPGHEEHDEGSWDLDFRLQHVPVDQIDYADHGSGDPRVESARRWYRSGVDNVVPPVLVHRHGVYQVADGHHRGEAARLEGLRMIPAYVAYSPHESEPFSEGGSGPYHGARIQHIAAIEQGDTQYGLGSGHTAPGPGEDSVPFHDPEHYLPDVYEHPEYYVSPYDRRDPLVHRSGMENHRALVAARGKPDAQVKIYRAVPHGITEIEGNTNPAGASWVSASLSYAKRHAAAESCPSCGGDMQVISGTARADQLHNEGYLEEWGYSGNPIKDESALTECPEGAFEARKAAEAEFMKRQAVKQTPAQEAAQKFLESSDYWEKVEKGEHPEARDTDAELPHYWEDYSVVPGHDQATWGEGEHHDEDEDDDFEETHRPSADLVNLVDHFTNEDIHGEDEQHLRDQLVLHGGYQFRQNGEYTKTDEQGNLHTAALPGDYRRHHTLTTSFYSPSTDEMITHTGHDNVDSMLDRLDINEEYSKAKAEKPELDYRTHFLNWVRKNPQSYTGQKHNQFARRGYSAPESLTVKEYEGQEGNPSHITRNETGMAPLDWVRHLHGYRGERPGEHRNEQGEDWEDFKRNVAAGTPGYADPIFIMVDHGKEPRIAEGNHRRDAYAELGHTHVPVEIRYFGHSERQGTVGERAMRRTGAVEESGLKAAGIAVIAMDTGRVLMLQRALNPLTCPCGQGVTWDEMNGYQHDDGSVSHDDSDLSVSEMLDQGHPEPCSCCLGEGDDVDGSECAACDGSGSNQEQVSCDPPCREADSLEKTSAIEYDHNEGVWEFPGGCLDEGEPAREAAIREFREEVGQDLPPGVFVGAWLSPGGITVTAARVDVTPHGYPENYRVWTDTEFPITSKDIYRGLNQPMVGLKDTGEDDVNLDGYRYKHNDPVCATCYDRGYVHETRSIHSQNDDHDFTPLSPAEGEKRFGAVRLDDTESMRRAIRTLRDPSPQHPNVGYNRPELHTLDGKQYFVKSPQAIEDHETGAFNEVMSSLVGRALGANISRAIHAPRGGLGFYGDHAVFVEAEPGLRSYTGRGEHSQLVNSRHGKLLGAVDSLLDVPDHMNGRNSGVNSRGEPHAFDYEGAAGFYQPHGVRTTSDFAHHYVVHARPAQEETARNHHTPGTLTTNPLTQRDVERGRAALQSLHPVFEKAGYPKGHANLMSRWEDLAQHAGGQEGEDILPESLPSFKLLTQANTEPILNGADPRALGQEDYEYGIDGVCPTPGRGNDPEAQRVARAILPLRNYKETYPVLDADKAEATHLGSHNGIDYYYAKRANIKMEDGRSRDTGHHHVFAVDGDRKVGDMQWRDVIGHLATDPDYRRSGVARKMYELGWELHNSIGITPPIHSSHKIRSEDGASGENFAKGVGGLDEKDIKRGDWSKYVRDEDWDQGAGSALTKAHLDRFGPRTSALEPPFGDAIDFVSMGWRRVDPERSNVFEKHNGGFTHEVTYEPNESSPTGYAWRLNTIGAGELVGGREGTFDTYHATPQAAEKHTKTNEANWVDVGLDNGDFIEPFSKPRPFMLPSETDRRSQTKPGDITKAPPLDIRNMPEGHPHNPMNPVRLSAVDDWHEEDELPSCRECGSEAPSHGASCSLIGDPSAYDEVQLDSGEHHADEMRWAPGESRNPFHYNGAAKPVYKGFVYLIQSEKDIDLSLREIVNPDDPDGDMSEQCAWWDIEHAKANPALREEVKTGTPWEELELWADKSVRANKEVKEAFTRLAAQTPAQQAAQKWLDENPEDFTYWHNSPDASIGRFDPETGEEVSPESARQDEWRHINIRMQQAGFRYVAPPSATQRGFFYRDSPRSPGMGQRITEPTGWTPYWQVHQGPARSFGHSDFAVGMHQELEDALANADYQDTRLTHEAAQKCNYCKKPASKIIVHSEGIGRFPVCDDHLAKGKDMAEHCTPGGEYDPTNISSIKEANVEPKRPKLPDGLVYVDKEIPYGVDEHDGETTYFWRYQDSELEPIHDYENPLRYGPNSAPSHNRTVDWQPMIMWKNQSDYVDEAHFDRAPVGGFFSGSKTDVKWDEPVCEHCYLNKGISMPEEHHSSIITKDHSNFHEFKPMIPATDERGNFRESKTAAPLTTEEPRLIGDKIKSGEHAHNHWVDLTSGQWLRKRPHGDVLDGTGEHEGKVLDSEDRAYFMDQAHKAADVEEFASRLGKALSDPTGLSIAAEAVRGNKAGDLTPTVYVRKTPDFHDMEDMDDDVHSSHVDTPRGKLIGFFHSVLGDGDKAGFHNVGLVGRLRNIRDPKSPLGYSPDPDNVAGPHAMTPVSIDHTMSSLPDYADARTNENRDTNEVKRLRWHHQWGEISPFEKHFMLRSRGNVGPLLDNPLAPGDSDRAVAAVETLRPWAQSRGIEHWVDAAQNRMQLLGKRAAGTESLFPYTMAHEANQKTAAERRRSGGSPPGQRQFPLIRDVITAGKPEYSIRSADQVTPKHHDMIIDSEKPVYSQEDNTDPSHPSIYALRNNGGFTFLVPVTHNKTGEDGWLRGSTNTHPSKWRYYDDEDDSVANAIVGRVPKLTPEAERSYGRRRGFPGRILEGDVPLDEEGHQVVEPKRDLWVEPEGRYPWDFGWERAGDHPLARADEEAPWWASLHHTHGL